MISSMTGYAVAVEDAAGGALQLELRAVNSRFLDLQFRIADELRALEPALREAIAARVTRGKLDCRLSLGEDARATQGERLDAAALGRLRALAAQAKGAFPDAAPLRLADVLRWPGVLAGAPADAERQRTVVERLCRKALDELVASRRREGAKLAAAVGERIAAMRARVQEIAPLLPAAMAAYQQKIAERLREAIGSADDERVRAEVALFAAKSDVDEELTRLYTHLDEVDRVLAKGGAAGKRLDFIAQELNREANTLASKAASPKIADSALELKVLVEQIREQVQNIE